MPIYTRLGDSGKTRLYTPQGAGPRVGKDDVRVEAYGTVDELNALIGLLRSLVHDQALDREFRDVQETLFRVGYDVATLSEPRPEKVTANDVKTLETAIDRMTKDLPPLRRFILPAGPQTAATAHVARTVCRRAERRMVALQGSTPLNPHALAYVNRLSDYLFTVGRHLAGGNEQPVAWRP